MPLIPDRHTHCRLSSAQPRGSVASPLRPPPEPRLFCGAPNGRSPVVRRRPGVWEVSPNYIPGGRVGRESLRETAGQFALTPVPRPRRLA